MNAVERAMPEGVDDAFDRRLREKIAEVVGDRYEASNRAWSELTGIDLSAYGYAVAAPASVRAENEALPLG